MDVALHREGRQGRELLPGELDLFFDEPEEPETPALEVDPGRSPVREHRPVFDDFLAGRQAVAPLFAVFSAAREDIGYHNATLLRIENTKAPRPSAIGGQRSRPDNIYRHAARRGD